MNFAPIISAFLIAFICVSPTMEADAVRPPLEPLNSEQFHYMIVDADLIVTGTVTSVTLSKTMQPPLETVTIHVTLTLDKILKTNRSMETIEIEESYQHYSKNDGKSVSNGQNVIEKAVTPQIAGPAPPVGRYKDGDRVLVFLKSIPGSIYYRPLGSGSYDAYLGLFQISSNGVISEKYRFDETLSGYAHSEVDFLKFITSNIGE
jgi:hypothetical protein